MSGLALIALAPQLAGDKNQRGVAELVALGYALMLISIWLPD